MGKWVLVSEDAYYLYRAVEKFGNMIDFYLFPTRNAKTAKRFLGKALKEGRSSPSSRSLQRWI
jgi:transposase-like protein